jgi:hypothetical protein
MKRCIVIAKLGHATSQNIIQAEHEGLNHKKTKTSQVNMKSSPKPPSEGK